MVRKYSISVALCSLLGGGALLNAQEVQVLDDAVVSASGFAQEIKEAPATINVITKEELQRKPYRDIAEAIADIPGVDISRGKTGTFSIKLRGMSDEYTLILVDGRRQSVGGEIAPNFEGVQNGFMPPMSAIERIEVIKGPMSTLYGSEALGGIINIITKKVGDKWSASATTEALFQNNSDWGNLYGVSVYGSGPLIKDKLGLTLRAREFYREASDVKIENNKGDMTQQSMGKNPARANIHNFGARLSYLLDEKNTLIYDFDYSKNIYNNDDVNGGRMGRYTKPNKDKTALVGGYTKGKIAFDKIATYLSHQGTYDYFTLDSNIQYNRVTNDSREVVGKMDKPHIGENRDIQSEDIIVDTKAVIPILDWNMLSVGAEYRFQKMTDKILQPSNFDQYLLGIYAEDEISILDNLNLTLGARYNKHEIFGNNVSPRAYLVWNATDELTLKGGVATGFKAPFANELIFDTYGFGGQGRYAFYGNPDVKEETSINYELGAIYQAEKFYIGATGFLTDFKDKIELIPMKGKCLFDGCSQIDNVGKVRYMGVEFSAGAKPVENLNLDLSYTYLDSEIKKIRESDKELIGKPVDSTLKHNLILKASYKILDFTPWIKGKWQGDRYAGEKDMEYYDDVFLMDVGLGYNINDNWNLNFAVNNLLDKDFVEYTDKGTAKFYGLEEGRRFWVSLTGSF